MKALSLVRKVVIKYSALIVICSAFAVTGVANATSTAQLSVNPSTDLKSGQTVTVSGTGFADTAPGGISECNGEPNQPEIAVVPGDYVAVGCTNPFLPNLYTTSSKGDLASTPFVVQTGDIGPPTTGADSCTNPGGTAFCTITKGDQGYSGDAATDAKDFPCPPTASQTAAGITCNISYGNSESLSSSTNITFYTAPPSSSPTGGQTNTTTGGTTSSTSKTSSTTQLVNTGPGNVAIVAAIIAAGVSMLAFLVYSRGKVLKNR